VRELVHKYSTAVGGSEHATACRDATSHAAG
jgi:hypothetical protein